MNNLSSIIKILNRYLVYKHFVMIEETENDVISQGGESIKKSFAMKYVCYPKKFDGQDFSNDAKFIVKETTNGMGKGLFAMSQIPQNALILRSNDRAEVFNISLYMNDPLFQMDILRKVRNHDEMYSALKELQENYYDEKIAEQKVNVVLGSSGYITIKPVLKGEQLFRIYGFSAWLFEIWEHLKVENIQGYHRFLEEKTKDIDLTLNDPISKHAEILNNDFYLYKMKVTKLLIDNFYETGYFGEPELQESGSFGHNLYIALTNRVEAARNATMQCIIS